MAVVKASAEEEEERRHPLSVGTRTVVVPLAPFVFCFAKLQFVSLPFRQRSEPFSQRSEPFRQRSEPFRQPSVPFR